MLIDGAVAVAGLATSTSVHLKGARRGSASTRAHKVLEDYKEMVVEASALPPEGLVVVNLNSLEDLARAAEVLMKSIIKVVDYEGQLYCVIDGSVRYQYKLREGPARGT